MWIYSVWIEGKIKLVVFYTLDDHSADLHYVQANVQHICERGEGFNRVGAREGYENR